MNSPKKDLVSVIIPTYNRAQLLKEAIQSVINQTHRPIECIVVDDGSSDNTSEIIQSFESAKSEDFNLIYILQSKSGAQVARNSGTGIASGEFIQYFDSDDLLYPDKFLTQIKFLNSNPGYDGVFGDWEVGTPETKDYIKAYESSNLFKQFLIDRNISIFSFLFKRGIVFKSEFWDPSIKRNQEIDFQLSLILSGARFKYQSFNTGLWRKHQSERITYSMNSNVIIHFYNKWEKKLNDLSVYDDEMKFGIAGCYKWFIVTYPQSSFKDLVKLLKQVYRLNSNDEIFDNFKFKLSKGILGSSIAMKLWVIRFKIHHLKVNKNLL